MIEKLKNSDLEIAKKMRLIFQASYKVEAKLLNVTNFPPLKQALKMAQLQSYMKNLVL